MAGKRYDALFIDFYGTITSGDRQAVEAACASVVQRLKLTVSAPDLAVAWGRRFFNRIDVTDHLDFKDLYQIEVETLLETVVPLVGPFDPEPFVTALRGYWSSPPLQPEAAAALAAVRAMNVPICCVSNADTADILAAVEKHGLRFDHLVTSEDARAYKPNAAIFEKALKDMGVVADKVMHVGDSLHSDIGGARGVGIAATWICRDDRIFDVGEHPPDHKIKSLMELSDLMR